MAEIRGKAKALAGLAAAWLEKARGSVERARSIIDHIDEEECRPLGASDAAAVAADLIGDAVDILREGMSEQRLATMDPDGETTGPKDAPGRPKRLLARIEEVGDPYDVRTVNLTEARIVEALGSYDGDRRSVDELEILAGLVVDWLWESAEDPVPEGDPVEERADQVDLDAVAIADEELVRRAVANARIAATLVRFREDLNLHNEISDDELARLGADVLAVSLAHGSSSVGPRAFRPEPPQGLTDEELVRRAVRVAGWRGPLRPRWAAVRDSFSCGSTVASLLCSRFDLNPDEEVGQAPGGDPGELDEDTLIGATVFYDSELPGHDTPQEGEIVGHDGDRVRVRSSDGGKFWIDARRVLGGDLDEDRWREVFGVETPPEGER